MVELIEKLLKRYRTLILYGLIGVTGAALDYSVYYLLYSKLGIPPSLASFLSVSVGIVNNYILNARHNFKVKGNTLYRFGTFYLTGIGGAILSSLLIYLLFNVFGVSPNLAKLLTIPPVVLLQFIINLKVTFADKPKRSVEQ